MLDQSFSTSCFQEIFDRENRKGNNIEKRFKLDFEQSIAKLKELENINKLIKFETNSDIRKNLQQQKKDIKKERERIISDTLEKIADRISKHKINLIHGDNHGAPSYKFEEKIENFFISKKIQENINQTYNVKQSSRYSILSELINLLEDKFPKYIIRLDIKSFYESIPQKNILTKVKTDYLLSIRTKEYIEQIFDSYNILTRQSDINTSKGVPRGIGVSAYLSELFMRKIDNKIQELKDVVYYARYVDDMIVIFIPSSRNPEKSYLASYQTLIKEIIKDEGGEEFTVNESKTQRYNLLPGINSLEIEKHNYLKQDFLSKTINSNPKPIVFLGYKIGSLTTFVKKKDDDDSPQKTERLCVELSDNKIDKYKNKIKLTFQSFNEKKKYNFRYAFKLLEARIRYLTSNTKLTNNKDNVFIGIYYSNPFLNNDTSLEILQRSLKYYINRAHLDKKEKEILNQYSFITGFKNKKFELLPFKNKKYKNYNSRRNDINNKNNKGVVQFGISEINSIWKK